MRSSFFRINIIRHHFRVLCDVKECGINLHVTRQKLTVTTFYTRLLTVPMPLTQYAVAVQLKN